MKPQYHAVAVKATRILFHMLKNTCRENIH
jgi:hypothetical protein